MLTRAESTGYRETSLHADVMRFVADLDALGDPRLHVSDFGRSPGGRELPLLILSRDGLRTPEEARRSGRPVVLMQDGIHPGEVEGKEASLALVRDLLAGHHPDWLSEIVLLVVPLFNPDGNDRIDPKNRALDQEVLALWKEGRHDAVLDRFPELEAAKYEGHGAHYAQMMGALGGKACRAKGTQLSEYENAAGTGNVHVWFDL